MVNKKKLTSKHSIYLSAILILGAYLYYFKLGSYPLISGDELYYTNQAKNALLEGHWPVLQMQFLEKDVGMHEVFGMPPLFPWVQALSMTVFGINEFGARLPSATAAILTGVLVYFIGREYLDEKTGFISSIIFLTTPQLLLGSNGGRYAATDTLLTLLGTLVIFTVIKALREDRKNLLVYSGILMGCAFLTKQVASFVFIFALLPAIWKYRDRIINKAAATGALIGSAISLPWVIYMAYEYFWFWYFFIDYQVVNRIKDVRNEGSGNTLLSFIDAPYIHNLTSYMDPWLYFLIPGTIYSFWRVKEHRDEIHMMLLWWMLSIYLFYVAFGTYLHYILPALVPASLITGDFIKKAIYRNKLVDGKIIAFTLGSASTLVFSSGLSLSSFSFTWKQYPHKASQTLLTAGIVVLTVFTVVKPYFDQKWKTKDLKVGAGVLIVLVACISVFEAPVLHSEMAESQKKFGAEIRDLESEKQIHVSPNMEIVYTKLYGIPFYSKRDFQSTDESLVDKSDLYLTRKANLTEIDEDYSILAGEKFENGDFKLRLLKIKD